jgi:ABC-type multidrug transport system permease subunit
MGSLLQNTMQVNTWSSIVLFAILTPGFPMLSLPAVFEKALHLIPTFYFVEALKLSLSGAGSGRIWGHLAVVLACTFLAFFAATWGLRRRLN